MKVFLGQPGGAMLFPSVHIRMCYVEPIGLEYVASAASAVGHDCALVYPLTEEDSLRAAIKRIQPDVCALSIYTYAFPEAVRWAQTAKQVRPNVRLIAGGHHPTALPEQVLRSGFDYAVIGEGEQTFVELLDYIERGAEGDIPAGVATARHGTILIAPPRKRITDLAMLPFPQRLPHVLEQARNFQIIYPPPSQQRNLAQVSYSRGCPNNCCYCSSPQMWRRQVVWRFPASVLDEIESLQETYGTNLIYFPDLELNASRRHLHELCDEFVRRRLDISWWGLFSAGGMDDALLDHLVDAGCVKLSLGVEGVGNEALARLSVTKAPRWEQVMELFAKAQARGLITRIFLMIGNSWDTPEYYARIVQEIPDLAADDMRVSFTTPFPGTELYRGLVARGELAHTSFARFTTEEPILHNDAMSGAEILDWRDAIVSSFYGSSKYRTRAMHRVSRHPRLRSPYVEYLDRLLIGGGLHPSTQAAIYSLVSELQASEGALLHA